MKNLSLAALLVLLFCAPAFAGDDDPSFGTWDVHKFPLRVYFFPPDKGVYNYEPRHKTLTIDAFKDWQAKTNGFVSFVIVNKPPADIGVVFLDRIVLTRPGRKRAGQCRYFPHQVHHITKAQVEIVTTKSFSDSLVQHVAEHEIGHALGLGHSKDERDVMLQAGSTAPRISPNDVARLFQLYGRTPDGSPTFLSLEETTAYSAKILDFLNVKLASLPPETAGNTSTLSFSIDNSGNVFDAKTVCDSLTDKYVLTAIARAGAFPRPPMPLSEPFFVSVQITGRDHITLLASR